MGLGWVCPIVPSGWGGGATSPAAGGLMAAGPPTWGGLPAEAPVAAAAAFGLGGELRACMACCQPAKAACASVGSGEGGGGDPGEGRGGKRGGGQLRV